jgi:hypothetical protein
MIDDFCWTLLIFSKSGAEERPDIYINLILTLKNQDKNVFLRNSMEGKTQTNQTLHKLEAQWAGPV